MTLLYARAEAEGRRRRGRRQEGEGRGRWRKVTADEAYLAMPQGFAHGDGGG